MSNHQNVRSSVEDRIATLTLDHPPANSIDGQTLADLDASFDAALANAGVKVIIITGAGDIFCAGADIKAIAATQNYEGAKGLAQKGHTLFNKIESSPKPVIAAINGRYALGGGNELAMACHIRLAEESVRFGQPECNLGLIPGWGGTQRLPRLIGKNRALELLLTGRCFNAEEAYRLGLVNSVVPAGEALNEARKLAERLAAQSLIVLAATIETVNAGLDSSIEEGLKIEAERFASLFETEDMHEGVNAFIEKRRPHFVDR